MKLKQLLILLAVLAVVVLAVVFLKPSDDGETKGYVKVFPDLKTEEVTTVVMNGGKEEVTLEIKDGKWTVKDRESFPANFENVAKLVTKAGTLTGELSQTLDGEKYLSRFKLQKPGTGGKDDATGTSVTLKKADGTVLADFVIGKNVGNPAGPGGMSNASAQYFQPKANAAKPEVYTIKEAFDFTMSNITNRGWLDTSNFFRVEKPKSISVKSAKPEDDWKIFREKEGTDAAELKLADLKPGEEFESAKAANSGAAFAATTFSDIATAADKDKTGLDNPLRTATIETFDGFTYTIKIGKQVEKAVDPNAGATEEHYVSFDVQGAFPEKMPEPAPSPEDAKKSEEDKKKAREEAEKAFQAELATKKEKLAKEKQLATRVFVIGKFNVEPLLKNRAEFMKDKPAEGAAPAAPAAAGGAPAPMPTAAPNPVGPITATTPPISVDVKPAENAGEVKPATDAKEAKPAEEKKPAEAKP
jgi:hypothetical protein